MPTLRELRDDMLRAVGLAMMSVGALVGAAVVGLWIGERFRSPRISAEPPAPIAAAVRSYPACPSLPPSCHLGEVAHCVCIRNPDSPLAHCFWTCEAKP